LLAALDAATVPVTVLFDSDGTVLWSHVGAVDADQVNEALDTYTDL
jgi:predicted transcriptional regulator